jgi:SAM-dependent methyltransferase
MTTSFDHDNPRLAAIYDRLSESQFQSGKRLVERLELRSGNRVLDIGCGTGRLAEWIAEIVGPDGNVVGIDPLPERVAGPGGIASAPEDRPGQCVRSAKGSRGDRGARPRNVVRGASLNE